jgi:hypothetical protein
LTKLTHQTQRFSQESLTKKSQYKEAEIYAFELPTIFLNINSGNIYKKRERLCVVAAFYGCFLRINTVATATAMIIAIAATAM